jgi:hypothetical protein
MFSLLLLTLPDNKPDMSAHVPCYSCALALSNQALHVSSTKSSLICLALVNASNLVIILSYLADDVLFTELDKVIAYKLGI